MSTLNLTKGESLNLTKQAPGLTAIVAGAGWDVADGSAPIDLDLIAVALGENGKARNSTDAVFFNQLENGNKSIVHTGDNRTGDGEGDDEQIKIDLSAVEPEVKKIVLALHSYSGQDLAVVKNAFARIVNQADNAELARFDISESTSGKTLYMGELTRVDGGWEFKATGSYTNEDLGTVFAQYGI